MRERGEATVGMEGAGREGEGENDGEKGRVRERGEVMMMTVGMEGAGREGEGEMVEAGAVEGMTERLERGYMDRGP